MSDISPLAQYIRTEIFDHFATQRASLLEEKWQGNIDAFNSISSGKWKKAEASEDWMSDTFVGVTKAKVMSAWSLVVDMELQGGDIPFMLIPSPWDETVFEELPEEQQAQITASIEKMVDQIRQQLLDCNADRHLMKCIMSGAIYGETFGKRYSHIVERNGFKQVSYAPEGLTDDAGKYMRYEPYKIQTVAPGWEYASVWNIFRDLETDDLQKGRGVIHKSLVSPYHLRQKMGQPLYINGGIERAIKEAGITPADNTIGTLPPGQRGVEKRWNNIENLEFWGRVPESRVIMFEESIAKGQYEGFEQYTQEDDKGHDVEVLVELAGNEVIRFARHEENDRPFYRSVWEIKLDHVESTGVADNIEQSQTVLNGMIRAFEDNKKLSANIILAIKEELFAPGQSDIIKPGMKLSLSEDVDDARKALQQVIIQDVGATLLDGIGMVERRIDEESQIPKLSQGFAPDKQKPDTAYEMSQLLSNAGKYMGGVIKNFDEGLIEPTVKDFYQFNMDDPEAKGKGNYLAKALGFTSFQDRVIRTQNLQRFLALLLGHEVTLQEGKIDGILEEIAKSMDLEKRQVLKTIQEKQEEAQQRQESPETQMQLKMIELETEKKAAETEKVLADAKKINEEARAIFEELKIERAKVVQGMRQV